MPKASGIYGAIILDWRKTLALKSVKKIIISLAIVLIILVVAGGLLLANNLDRIVRVGTEKALSYALQVDVSVGSANVNVTEGRVAFDDIVIENPDGYKTDRAIRIGHVETQVDIASFRTDEPTIRDIQLSGAEITMEIKGKASNLTDLLENANRLAGESTTEADAEQPTDAEVSQKAFKIERVRLQDNSVRLSFGLLEGRTADLSLPDMELADLGGKNGSTPAQALADILEALIAKINVLSLDQLPTDLLDPFKDSLAGLTDQLQDNLDDVLSGNTEALKGAQDKLEGAADKLQEDLGKDVKDVKEGLKGLLGR